MEGRVSDYFERGEFDGSIVGREWNIRECQRMSEKGQREILHNKKNGKVFFFFFDLL